MQQLALITGATRGIGRACAYTLGAAGYRLALCYRQSEECARSLLESLTKSGVSAALYPFDVSDPVAVLAASEQIQRECGTVSILVNNAGIAEQKQVQDISDSDWQRMLGVNLSGPFYLCRALAPGMIRQQSGRIVNITSIWGQVGGSMESHYSAAKAGLIGLTKALSSELAPSGITVNAIAPGVIQTDMCRSLTSDTLEALKNETPLGRLGTPEDIAAAVAFLVSPAASFITGQVLGVNGGMVL